MTRNSFAQSTRRLIDTLSKPINYYPLFLITTTILLCIGFFSGTMHILIKHDWACVSEVFTGLLRGIFYAYLVSALVYAARSKLLGNIIVIILLFFLCVDITVKALWGYSLYNITVMKILAETNMKEATDMFKTFLGLKMVSGIVTFILLSVGWLLLTRIKRISTLRINTSISAVFLLMALCGFCSVLSWSRIFQAKDAVELERYYPGTYVDTPTKFLSNIASIRLVSKQNEGFIQQVKADMTSQSASMASDSIPLDIVVIIGESFIKNHSSAYGYKLPTTPIIDSLIAAGSMVAYDNAQTVATNTSAALQNFFSLNSFYDGESAFDHSFWPAMFRKAGYDVLMLDNQNTEKAGIFSFTLNSMIHNKYITDSVYTYTSTFTDPTNDAKFVATEFPEAVSRSVANKRLWIYHLWGQHVQASSRYPRNSDFDKFSAKDYGWRSDEWLTDRMKQRIAEYDNATLYNDYVIGKIIQDHDNRPSIVIYFSDHGEEVYDYRPIEGRVLPTQSQQNDVGFMEKYHEAIYEIPMLIYFNNRFAQSYPEITSLITSQKNTSVSIDLLGHTLLNIGKINSKYYNNRHDFLSSKYHPGQRANR